MRREDIFGEAQIFGVAKISEYDNTDGMMREIGLLFERCNKEMAHYVPPTTLLPSGMILSRVEPSKLVCPSGWAVYGQDLTGYSLMESEGVTDGICHKIPIRCWGALRALDPVYNCWC